MNIEILKSIIDNKKKNSDFAIITNLMTGDISIFKKELPLNKNLENYSSEINDFFNNKKTGIIENSELFIETFRRPTKVIVVGAVHITQYLIDYIKNLNFEINIIDPRGYFASKKRFPEVKVINKWPDEAFKEIDTNESTALIALTHDPKIDDPALQYALKKKFFYIGALGSKRTHENRCARLKKAGFSDEQINLIHGPIGIKIGGKSASEIALSIVSQLVLITNNR